MPYGKRQRRQRERFERWLWRNVYGPPEVREAVERIDREAQEWPLLAPRVTPEKRGASDTQTRER